MKRKSYLIASCFLIIIGLISVFGKINSTNTIWNIVFISSGIFGLCKYYNRKIKDIVGFILAYQFTVALVYFNQPIFYAFVVLSLMLCLVGDNE